jgi:SanA protein
MIARMWHVLSARWFRWGAVLIIASIAFTLWWCDREVKQQSSAFLYDRLDLVPHEQVGVVLGTSERGRGGGPNQYFVRRMEAAAALYHAGKVDHLLLSGDNRHMNYNEPWAMRKALMAAGVDSSHITLDFAGFRTLDSMVRAKEVFGQQRFIVISQRFHNERAVFIARGLGIEAIGYNAQDVGAAYGLRTKLRERLARVKVYIDALFGIQPHFLGEPVTIGEQDLNDAHAPLVPEAKAS